jgi:hypothetical protein
MHHTELWWDYWNAETEGLVAGEALDQKIPFEVIDALIHRAE